MKNKDRIACVVIYLLVLAFMLQYNLLHPLVNDRVYEYHDYLANIANGWEYRNSLLNSCLISTWVPSLIQRWTGWDSMLVFKTLPPFFYALMPIFVYLIARRYLDVTNSIISSTVVIFSSFIIFFPDEGKVGIALGFMTGMIWALLGKRTVWAAIFAVLIVFSHYGTTIIATGIVMTVLTATLLWKRPNIKVYYNLVKPYLITLCILIILTGVWHFGIAKYSGNTMFDTMLQPEKAKEIMGEDWGNFDILNMEDRDLVAQKAFGLTFGDEQIPSKIEILSNWSIVALITLGLYLMLKNKKAEFVFNIMVLSLYSLILATIAIPQMSIYYGTGKVYFTALGLLAICFPFGIKWMASKLHLPPLLLSSAILSIYAISVSGIIYLPFGLTKVLPVVISLP